MDENVAGAPLTAENVQAWRDMCILRSDRESRIVEWAAMLERRVAELDPDYRVYQWGRGGE